MSHSFYIDLNLNCVFAKTTEHFELDFASNIFSKIISHPDYKMGMNIFRDFTEVAVPEDISYKYISRENKRRSEGVDQQLGKCKLAIVVRDVQSYKKVHQYIVSGRLSSNPVDRKVFRDIEKAKLWLEIPENYQFNYSDID